MEYETPKESPPPPAQQTLISQPVHSDSLFITQYGSVLQYSIRSRKFLKHYGKLLKLDIAASTTSADKKHLFIGDEYGNVKQISIKLQKVTHDFEKIVNTVYLSMATTFDNEYVFLGCGIELKQYQISSHELVK